MPCEVINVISQWRLHFDSPDLQDSFNLALFCGFHEKYTMWKFIVDVVHDLRSSLRPDVGRGFFFYMSPMCSCYTKTWLDPFHCQVIILHLFNFHFIIIVQICNWKSLRCTIYKKFELIQTNLFFFRKCFLVALVTTENGTHTFVCIIFRWI